jgi:hypothetical protein
LRAQERCAQKRRDEPNNPFTGTAEMRDRVIFDGFLHFAP